MLTISMFGYNHNASQCLGRTPVDSVLNLNDNNNNNNNDNSNNNNNI